MNSACCKAQLQKAPLFANKLSVGKVYFCPHCLSILYYEGKFVWSGWEMRQGIKGYGAHYGKKKEKAQSYRIVPSAGEVKPYKNVVVNHSLDRKEELAKDAYVKS